jgi:gas vesicle protein
MGKLLTIILSGVLISLASAPAFAQKDEDKDVSITIRVNGEDRDLETYFEEWGEEFGDKMEHLFEKDIHVNINLDDEDLHIAIDEIAEKTAELGKAIGEAVKEAVTHLNIEMEDLSREDLLDHNFEIDDTEISDIIEDIEDRYDSKVKKIEYLKISIREDYIKVKMNILLENGKRIEKVRIMNHD